MILVARTIAYALTPQPTALSVELQRSAGGPQLLLLTAVVLSGALLLSVGVVGFAALAVRERRALEPALVLLPPRVRLLRLAWIAVMLFVVSAAGFALLESYLHWRAGLGWHGLHCLTGPVHRDALPILAALSLIAAAVIEAIEHLVAWAHRTFAKCLQRSPLRSPHHRRYLIESRIPGVGRLGAALPARGPPSALGRRLAATAALDT